MANYSKVDGAEVEKWGDSEDPLEEYQDAKIEEMYFEPGMGQIYISIQISETEIISIRVPVRAQSNWNEFVESLPTWNNVE